MPRVARISPVTTAVTVFGIIFLGAFPPVGMMLLIAAFFIQRRYRAERRHAQAARAARIDRQRAKARASQLEMAFRIGSL